MHVTTYIRKKYDYKNNKRDNRSSSFCLLAGSAMRGTQDMYKYLLIACICVIYWHISYVSCFCFSVSKIFFGQNSGGKKSPLALKRVRAQLYLLQYHDSSFGILTR